MEQTLESVQTNSMQTVYAGFWIRFAAAFIDAIILGVVQMIITYMFFSSIMMNPDVVTSQSAGSILLYYVVILVVNWLYSAALESSSRQGTAGKIALDMKVTDLSGNRISFAQATGRYFSKFISIIILFIGFIMVAFDSKKQGLHDKIAGTYVIKK